MEGPAPPGTLWVRGQRAPRLDPLKPEVSGLVEGQLAAWPPGCERWGQGSQGEQEIPKAAELAGELTCWQLRLTRLWWTKLLLEFYSKEHQHFSVCQSEGKTKRMGPAAGMQTLGLGALGPHPFWAQASKIKRRPAEGTQTALF